MKPKGFIRDRKVEIPRPWAERRHEVPRVQGLPWGIDTFHFGIPLYLNHVVSEIRGKNRVEAVEITPRDGSKPFVVSFDTVLLSIGLVPDTEVAKTGGVALNPETGGPLVDYRHETSVPGIFACGNVLHVHDLVDYVTEESIRCAASVNAFIGEEPAGSQIGVHAGANLKYVVPGKMMPGEKNYL